MARGKRKFESFKWVIKVAFSAKTPEQKASAANLVANFQRQYRLADTDPDLDMQMDCLHDSLTPALSFGEGA